MNYFDKSRVLIAMVALLVVLNVATLGFLWTQRPPHPRGRPGGPPAQYLIEKVGLTPDQQVTYKELIQSHQQHMRSINDSIRYHKIQLFKYLTTPDSTMAYAESARIGSFQQSLEMSTFSHFSSVRALCSPVQVIKFDKVIDDVLKMMAPPPPPR